MKIKSKEISVSIYFLVAALLIAFLFPREGKFRYQYQEGKPWRYGLLTASFDFPIYKTEAEVKHEQDSILQYYVPYFQLQKNVMQEQIDKLEADYKAIIHPLVNRFYLVYLKSELEKIYGAGIISRDNRQFLEKEKFHSIKEFEGNEALEIPLEKVYTVQTAYAEIMNDCPSHLSPEVLKTLNVNKYIVENLIYDQDMSDKVKNELLQQVSLASGMVQAGERIVDQGIIVDNKTFNILNSLKIVSQNRMGSMQHQGWILTGIFMLVIGLYACFFLYLYFFRQKFYAHRKNTIFLLFMITSFAFLTEMAVNYSLFNVYIIPYMIVPIVICTFFDTRTALFAHITMILLCAVMVPFPMEFMLLQIIAGMTVIFSLKDLTERSQLIRCSFFVFLSYAVFYTGLILFQEGDITKIRWQMFMYFGINFIFLMFTYALVYLIEKTFGYVSNVSLVELSNINHPVLRKLSETCPGTFQHSLQVSILATEAAAKIGANIQLTRTGALYHDIGKMKNPTYFTENQSGYNPHIHLNFEESAKIIVDHVPEGERIARKYNLPDQIIQFILTHHGQSKAMFFYNSFKNAFPDRQINDAIFTYPGPNPFSKETGILMMADSVEAASHSLKEYTDETVGSLIDRIIDSKINEGLLKDTPLTFKDIEDVKAVFNEKLRTMYHTRIEYPELANKAEKPVSES